MFGSTIIKFIITSFISYVTRRATGEFMDELFDSILKSFAEATESKADDELLEKWRNKIKKGGNNENIR